MFSITVDEKDVIGSQTTTMNTISEKDNLKEEVLSELRQYIKEEVEKQISLNQNKISESASKDIANKIKLSL